MTESMFFFHFSIFFPRLKLPSNSDDGGPRLTSVPWNVFSSSELQTFNIRFFHLVLFSACTYGVYVRGPHV